MNKSDCKFLSNILYKLYRRIYKSKQNFADEQQKSKLKGGELNEKSQNLCSRR